MMMTPSVRELLQTFASSRSSPRERLPLDDMFQGLSWKRVTRILKQMSRYDYASFHLMDLYQCWSYLPDEVRPPLPQILGDYFHGYSGSLYDTHGHPILYYDVIQRVIYERFPSTRQADKCLLFLERLRIRKQHTLSINTILRSIAHFLKKTSR